MNRTTLDDAQIHPAIRARVAPQRDNLVPEVQAAVATHDIVIVGMRHNPYPRKARRLLDKYHLPYTYLEYGSYFSEWDRRFSLKLWTGWPTFPMIFVKGIFVGGASDLELLLKSGEVQKRLAAG